ncbi:MAG: hypothetical protein OXH70_03930 [Acidobacteria bacterium]|nr:hypothetical protein [Acidobacteriota bacterium]
MPTALRSQVVVLSLALSWGVAAEAQVIVDELPPILGHLWVTRHGNTDSEGFSIPDGAVLRPQNGGRLKWCD